MEAAMEVCRSHSSSSCPEILLVADDSYVSRRGCSDLFCLSYLVELSRRLHALLPAPTPPTAFPMLCVVLRLGVMLR